MKVNWKLIGLAATVGGALMTVIGDLAGGKQQEETIKEQVAEQLSAALAEHSNEGAI